MLEKEEVANALRERGATKSCHRCGKDSFSISEDFTEIYIQKELGRLHVGGPSVPAVIVICNNCGAITTHALAALGLKDKVPLGKNHEW